MHVVQFNSLLHIVQASGLSCQAGVRSSFQAVFVVGPSVPWGLRSREGPWPSVAFVLLAASLLVWAVGLTSRLDRENSLLDDVKKKKT